MPNLYTQNDFIIDGGSGSDWTIIQSDNIDSIVSRPGFDDSKVVWNRAGTAHTSYTVNFGEGGGKVHMYHWYANMAKNAEYIFDPSVYFWGNNQGEIYAMNVGTSKTDNYEISNLTIAWDSHPSGDHTGALGRLKGFDESVTQAQWFYTKETVVTLKNPISAVKSFGKGDWIKMKRARDDGYEWCQIAGVTEGRDGSGPKSDGDNIKSDVENKFTSKNFKV